MSDRASFPWLVFATLSTLVLTVLANEIWAHPHHHVDQQAQLTIGTDEVRVVLRIVPSIDEGAAIFDAIDADRDGTVSKSEATAFAAELVAAVELRFDGALEAFGEPSVSVPERDLAARGGGVIEVGATAKHPLGQGDHRIDLVVTDRRFAPDWFVQPFYTRPLTESTSSRRVERGDDGGVTVLLRR